MCNRIYSFFKILCAGSLLVMLTACGGGGGGDKVTLQSIEIEPSTIQVNFGEQPQEEITVYKVYSDGEKEEVEDLTKLSWETFLPDNQQTFDFTVQSTGELNYRAQFTSLDPDESVPSENYRVQATYDVNGDRDDELTANMTVNFVDPVQSIYLNVSNAELSRIGQFAEVTFNDDQGVSTIHIQERQELQLQLISNQKISLQSNLTTPVPLEGTKASWKEITFEPDPSKILVISDANPSSLRIGALAEDVNEKATSLLVVHNGKATVINIVVHQSDWQPNLVGITAKLASTSPDAQKTVIITETVQLRAEGRRENGDLSPNIDAEWESLTPEFASVDENGLVRGVAKGTARIQATVGNFTSTISLVVTEFPINFDITKILPILPSERTVTKGASLDLILRGEEDGVPVAINSDHVEWESSDSNIVAVLDGGKAIGIAVGTAVITGKYAEFPAQSVTINVVEPEVIPEIVSVFADPASTTVAQFGTKRVYLYGRKVGLDDEDLSTASTWSSSDQDKAYVVVERDSQNRLIANLYGVAPTNGTPVTMTAKAPNGMESTMQVTVTSSDPVGLFISQDPGEGQFLQVAENEQFQLSAFLLYPNGGEESISGGVTWSSENDSVATFEDTNGIGVLRGVTRGTTKIIASYEGSNGSELTDDFTVQIVEKDFVSVHYHRDDENYAGWGLHVWFFDGTADNQTTWEQPLQPTREDSYGVIFDVDIDDLGNGDEFCFIVHKGDEKDVTSPNDGDRCFKPSEKGLDVWLMSGVYSMSYTQPSIIAADAYWIDRSTLAINTSVRNGTIELHYQALNKDLTDVTLVATEAGVTGSQKATLSSETAFNQNLYPNYAHLQNYTAATYTGTASQRAQMIQGPLYAVVKNSSGVVVKVSKVQVAGLLDAEYATSSLLGIEYSETSLPLAARLWAPTALDVELLVFDSVNDGAPNRLTMNRSNGVWSATLSSDHDKKLYQYEVDVYVPALGRVETYVVADPYATALTANSEFGIIGDINRSSDTADYQPTGWVPGLVEVDESKSSLETAIYELHVREMTYFDTALSQLNRGKFASVADTNASVRSHLSQLQSSGLTHVNLMPVADFAGVPEKVVDQDVPSIPTNIAADSEIPRERIRVVRESDGYSWGMRPVHLFAPEGSYASDPDSATARIKEFRSLVQSFKDLGLNTSLTMIISHVDGGEDGQSSLFEKIVPGYYHRTNSSGRALNTMCEQCADLASEREMVHKLLLDAAVHWAANYNIGGFRFDQMGMATEDLIDDIKQEVLDINEDIFLFGEAWASGSYYDRNPENAFTQENSKNEDVATFNDKFRDAIRGGGFGKPLSDRGFATGLTFETSPTTLKEYVEDIKAGLAGNLDTAITGANRGYTASPRENMNYVSANYDNTFWDAIAAKAQFGGTSEITRIERLRFQLMAISLTALAQGTPFFNGGIDMLRSKSGDANSYDSGDWFNRIDFQSTRWDDGNRFGYGLPPTWADNASDAFWSPRLRDTGVLRANRSNVETAVIHMDKMLAVRKSTPLLNLRTRSEVAEHLKFHVVENNEVIMMEIQDGDDVLGGDYRKVVVVFNMQESTFERSWGEDLELHPTLNDETYDSVLANNAKHQNGKFFVPGLRTAVFVIPRNP